MKATPRKALNTVTFAVPGYNLPMEVEVLKRYALSAAPDLIIYGYYENDYCLPNFVSAKKSIWSTELFLKSYLVGATPSRCPTSARATRVEE